MPLSQTQSNKSPPTQTPPKQTKRTHTHAPLHTHPVRI